MSMYNALFGENALATVLLIALGTERARIPRYRDCWYADGKIVIYTRTGGGNRDFYESRESCYENYPEDFSGPGDTPKGPWNADLRKLPGFIDDADDSFDNTYAKFYFKLPEAFAPIIEVLKEIGLGEVPEPAERWKRLIADMRAGKETEETKRALEVGGAIAAQINEGKTILEV